LSCAVPSSRWRRRLNNSAYTDAVEASLKERLTGALIVVALLVIVVPEMLSGSGQSSTPANTPNDGGPPLRTYSLELGSPITAPTQDQSTLAPVSPEPALPTPSVIDAPGPATTPAPAAIAETGSSPQDVKAEVASPASPKQAWWTQLGSFSARENADRLARELRAKGFSIDVARIKVGNKDLYRVRAGPVASRDAGIALQSRLAAAGHKSRLVPP
jgi:DedD protein